MAIEFRGRDLVVRFKEDPDNQAIRQYKIEYQCANRHVIHYLAVDDDQGTSSDGLRLYKDQLTHAENEAAGLTRQPRVLLYSQNADLKWSEGLVVNAENPLPVFSSAPTIKSLVDGVEVSAVVPSDSDFEGFVAWVGTTADFPLDAAHERYRGKSSTFSLQLPDDDTYYLRVAPYDAFGLDTFTAWDAIPVKRGNLGGMLEGALAASETIAALEAAQAQLATEVEAAQGEASTARSEVAQTRTDLDDAVADLAAEVTRAKGAEGTLTQTLASVKQTADGAAAGLTDEVTIRTNADTALANRATALESTVNSGTDGNAALKSRISSEETTRANADTAIANRATALESSVNTGPNNLTSLRSGIIDEATTRANADTAISNRTTALESTVNSGTDGNAALKSRISTEETTRANAVSALAGRTSTLESQFTGATGSALLTRISTEETTRANADSALATRTTTLESRSGLDSASLLNNPSFVNWTTAGSPPDGWSWWDASGGITRAAGVNGRPFAAQFSPSAAQNNGILQDINAAFGSFVIEFTGRSTNWQSAGVLVYFMDTAGSVIESCPVHAATTPDTSGYTQADGGNGAYTRTFSVFFKTGVTGSIQRVRVYAMANWSGFGALTAKTITFDKVSIRPATASEIAAQRADTNASQALANITSEATTRANADSALATRATTLESQMALGTDSNLYARIRTEETTRSNGDSSLASRTSTLETTAGNLTSRVSTTEGAIAGLNGKVAAYWQVQAVAGNGRAQMTLHADANGGGGVDIVGDVAITGSNGNGRVEIKNTGFFLYFPNGQLAAKLAIT